ncbi:MAG: hypothetical protein ACWGNV_15645 [Bacteroidales bacterium]
MKKRVLVVTVAMSMGLMVPHFVSGTPLSESDSTSVVAMNDGVTFEKIETDDLPEAVSNTVSKDYAAFTIDQAYKGSDGSYKVAVSSGDLKYDLIFTKEGELSEVKDPNKE